MRLARGRWLTSRRTEIPSPNPLAFAQTSERIALPPLVRTVLKTAAGTGTGTGTGNGNGTYTPSAQLCSAFLLQFVVSDLSADRAGDCYLLDGLPLLPTRGGDVGRWVRGLRPVAPRHRPCMSYPAPRSYPPPPRG